MSNYHSNPASVLGKLIYHGVATETPECLSPEWRIGYEAARRLPHQGFVARRDAFESAVADEPARYIMTHEIEQAHLLLENPPEDQLRVYSAWETHHDPPPQLEFVVDGIFARSSLNFIVGAPGTKKTWTAIDLAVAVASGQPWLGHNTSHLAVGAHGGAPDSAMMPIEKFCPPEPEQPFVGAHGTCPERAALQRRGNAPADNEGGETPPLLPANKSQIENSFPSADDGSQTIGHPVLILDAEGGLTRTWDRIRRTINGHQSDPCIPLYFIPPVFYNLTDERETQSIAARARSLGAKLIIIDALTNVIGLTDENNPALIQPILKRLHQLAEDTGAAVVVVHHTNKEGVFRGSSFIASSVDHMLYVESQPQEPVLKLHTIKARDIEPVLIEAYADFHGDAFKLVKIDQHQSAPRAALSETCRNVLQYVLDHPQASTPHIIRRVNSISPSAARKVIYELMVGGFLCRTDPGSRGRIASYEISEKGLDYLSSPGAGTRLAE